MHARRVTPRQLAYALLWLGAVQAIGTAGFALLMDEGFVDAFYRTVVTVSTVGLDTLPHTAGAKLFSIVLIVAGVALFLYVIGLVTELTVSGVVSGARLERRTRRRVEGLEGHYVICGYGRVGERVAEEFRAAGVSYAVVDESPAAAAAAREHGAVAVEGSATDDEVLERAGIARARGLVACVDSDAENLYVVLSARELRPDLLIVARASSEDAGTKLRRGGADRVVSPYFIAGKELATLVLKPQVSAFLEVITGSGSPEFRLEQIEVTGACGLGGRTIRDLRIREETGALIVAHRRHGGSFDTRPGPDTLLAEGDILIGVGTPDEIRALEDMFRSREAVA
jgi:voltage-gated potassium channel